MTAISKDDLTDSIFNILKDKRSIGAGKPTDVNLLLIQHLGLTATRIEGLAIPITDWIHRQGLNDVIIRRHDLRDASTIKDIIDVAWGKIDA